MYFRNLSRITETGDEVRNNIQHNNVESNFLFEPSTSVDTANSASSCTPPTFPPALLNICKSDVMIVSEMAGASSDETLRNTD